MRLCGGVSGLPSLEPLPATAAWRHLDARTGFEVVFFADGADGVRLEGHAAAVEGSELWSVQWSLTVDTGWATRTAEVRSRSRLGERTVRLERDGLGEWRVDGEAAPELTGCLDVDLEASACTNTLPAHRLGLGIGEHAGAPAAYVRASDLRVERLEQRYERLADEPGRMRYAYRAPAFGYDDVLVYDASGLVLEYPGLATRAA